MKKLAVFLMIASSSIIYAQSILGTYTQSAFLAPDKIRDAATKDLVITKDPVKKNVIWISNLLGNSRIYAVANTKTEDAEVYSIPPQTAFGYAVKLGCIAYKTEDSEISISLNNKTNCLGMSQSDYSNISVGKNGIKTKDISMNSKGAKIDVAKVLAGVQYVGKKN
ncbi:hypothetical protein [Kaistella jeonii]|uniref:Uncharacterized protein n=1 Tax=Kaistella jeonii TaxID=266749 RepID=A0A0C1FD17_9FLAO|nr:hypothetical protein [Kaistella jeonii]KIA89718.1 hypothetical protein OA86_03585 [Kaistella jeonii]SFB87774.1 hypothetical protein SAMN05421876_103178 [Kaistella jeonii]VEI95944.1 Uncharacterised protein [Kaistella jeonii]